MLQSNNWLLLDEPTAFMDYVTTKKVWSLVGQHVERRGQRWWPRTTSMD